MMICERDDVMSRDLIENRESSISRAFLSARSSRNLVRDSRISGNKKSVPKTKNRCVLGPCVVFFFSKLS